MVKRAVCLCDGKHIYIESIITVSSNGRQIYVPGKVEELRAKSEKNKLFCPCGCGANLILVAGNMKKPHFRLKNGTYESKCDFVAEGKASVDSKIVLKCWLDEKLKTDDVKPRVPISDVGDTNRRYEFSFLSRAKNVAVSYSYERENLSDEKFNILQAHSEGIQLIYIVDMINRGSNGQYPEALMKIQKRQGYCLLLEIKDNSYSEAKMCAVFYTKNNGGLWKGIEVAYGRLNDYSIAENGQLRYKNELLSEMVDARKQKFDKSIQAEKVRCEEEKKQQEAAKKCYEEDIKKNMEDNFRWQDMKHRDADDNCRIECVYCGVIGKKSKFGYYQGNRGVCNTCSPKYNALEKLSRVSETEVETKPRKTKIDATICPECRGKLQIRSGKFGEFMGCSNYPKCRFTRNII